MKMNRVQKIGSALLISFCILFITPSTTGDLESTFARCCALGANWARESQTCEKFPAPVPGEPSEHQSICITAASICCLRFYRESQCESAKQIARSGSECSTSSEPGGEFYKDCCDGCKLGLVSGNMAMKCSFQGFSFGYPWNDAYLECCILASPPGSVDLDIINSKLPSNSLNNNAGVFPDLATADENFLFANRVDGVTSVPDSENLCLQFPGQLCGHVCVPTRGSYICQCRAGFTLSVDGKTCIQDQVKDRCEVNNPCDHTCRDTGVSIECSCNVGFQLSLDQRTCDDIDECRLGNHQCLPAEQVCYNQPGSYSCINSDGSLSTPGLSWGPGIRVRPETTNLGGGNTGTNRIGVQGYSGSIDEADYSSKGICPTGYKYNLDSRVCDDVDECAVALGICGQGASCENSIGSYSCTPLITGDCPPGFTFDLTHQSCLDVDECSLGTHTCGPSELCLNTQGNYDCQLRESSSDCPPGYKFNAQIKICEDVNECLEGLHSCHPADEICRNIIGAYECDMRCQPGFQFTTDPPSCVDLNECLVDLHSCNTETEICVNIIGSYHCERYTENEVRHVTPLSIFTLSKATLATPVVQECPSGYGFDLNTTQCLDINECVSGLHNCTLSIHRCINTLGGYLCTQKARCSPGYEINSSTGECADVDECSGGLSNCLPGQICVNTEGSFDCRVECRDGFRYDPLDPAICVDINECLNNACTFGLQCLNTEGSFVCRGVPDVTEHPYSFEGHLATARTTPQTPHLVITTKTSTTTRRPRTTTTKAPCPRGYKRKRRNSECKDINECSEGTNHCLKATEECVNLPGTYTCRPKPCSRGFYRDSDTKECLDIDECSNLPCHSREECINTPGSFLCRVRPTCQDGFRRNPATQECDDINECLEDSPCDVVDRCINTRGSFRCRSLDCPAGYQRDPVTRGCKDVDECETGEHTCKAPAEECINSPGTYRCKAYPPCPRGFTRDPRSLRCVDVDECSDGSALCEEGEKCVNQYGRYRCQKEPSKCSRGYRYRASSNQCEDVDECSEGTDPCPSSSTCVNSEGSFRCIEKRPACDFGYTYDQRAKECKDIDECAQGLHLCSRTREKCFNLPGAYRCDRIKATKSPPTPTTTSTPTRTYTNTTTTTPSTTTTATTTTTTKRTSDTTSSSKSSECPDGYFYDVIFRTCKDINECSQDPCDENERCVNSLGAFSCTCNDGFSRDNDSGDCIDINECQLGLHTCEKLQRCDNTLGSFSCTRLSGCGTGYTLNHNTGKCEDINECIEGESPCQRNERCFNFIGSFECRPKINCGRGFQMNEVGNQCVDIDECEEKTDTCSGGQICTNRPGGYVCQCPKGYRLDASRECQDINECLTAYSRLCGNTGECQNIPGSYKCICKKGFKKSPNGETCVDVDECTEIEGSCEHNCINLWGSHYCTCNAGYKLNEDERTCSDINECEEIRSRGRLCLGMCANTAGSFKCTCPHGYRLEEDQRTCKDINECDLAGKCRDPDDICVNNRGSYRCQRITCPNNYVRDPNHRNRCKKEKLCQEDDVACFQQPLTYSYNFLPLASNMTLRPLGQVDLFTMRGPLWSSTDVQFDLDLESAIVGRDGVNPATRSYFFLKRTSFNQVVLTLIKPLEGPQEVQLNLNMKLYHDGLYEGSAVAKLLIFVSQYDF